MNFRGNNMKANKKHPILRSLLWIIFLSIMILACLAVIPDLENRKQQEVEIINNEEINEKQPSVKEVEYTTAKILVAGDIMIHSPIYNSTYYHDTSTDTYDFSEIFKYIKEDYNSADYTLCTFEGSLGGGDLCGYPFFITPKIIMTNLKDSGIDCINLGSNHAYDGFDQGIQDTVNELDSIGLDYIGIRKDTDTKPYLIKEINGIKIGFIDYVYESNSYKALNGLTISNKSSPLINSFNYYHLDSFYDEIEARYKEMRMDGAEACLIIMHWGNEYQMIESDIQDTMAQKLCDIGFNGIIGSHPHVEQPVDLLTSTDGSHQTFVAYAIGNHLSNQRYEYLSNEANGQTEDGCMVNITITKDSNGNISITDLDFIYTWVYMQTTNGSNEYFILPLDDYKTLEKKTGIEDLGTDPRDSIQRSDAIMKKGIMKVQSALPIAISKKQPAIVPNKIG